MVYEMSDEPPSVMYEQDVEKCERNDGDVQIGALWVAKT